MSKLTRRVSKPVWLCAAATFATLTLAAPGTAVAQAPLIHHPLFNDDPLPPPCAADGVCRPRRKTYGYYATRWNRWPEDYDAAKPTPAGARNLLDPVPGIPPEEEDREAPAPSEEFEQESSAETPLPPLPPLLDRPQAAPREAPAEGGAAPQPGRRLAPLGPLRDTSVVPPIQSEGFAATPKTERAEAPPEVAIKPAPSTGSGQLQRLRWERAMDTPPALPAGLPEQSRMRWSRTSDAPPALPQQFTATGSAPRAETVNSYPVTSRRNRSSGRLDAAVRRTSGQEARIPLGKRAFYQPETPPTFKFGG